jgi:two-component system cell cycle sensor histidine kinase/response regulator CckA
LISWIRVEIQHRGLYRTETDIAALTVARTAILIIGIILLAREFTKRDAEGRQITGALQDRELHWSALFDQIRDGIVTLDENGKIETVNRPFERLFRYSAQELRGLPISRLLASPHREQIDQRLASGESVGLQNFRGIGREVQGLRKDGSLFPMELCINHFWLHERRLFSGVIRDITERHTAQQMTHHFAAIVEGTGDAIISNNLDGIVTSWNRGAQEIFGYSSKEMIGESIFQLISPDRPDDMHQILNRIRKGERVEHYQTERIAKDGRRLIVSLTASPLFDENHRVIGASKIARDITEQIRLEDHLRQSQRMEAVGQLAGSIAHDFNNLLTVINGYADLSLRGIDPSDPMHRRLSQIHASGERGAALTQHLLAFSRKQVLQPTVLNVNAIITGMEPLLRRLVRENIEFHILLKPSLPSITADPHQIEQVVMNLVINARDAMPAGGLLALETNVVSIDGQLKGLFSDLLPGTYLIITITDTGIGMDSNVQSRMFEPFFTTKPKGHGTGLGLATVFGVVRQSGGSIGVDSEVGVGTTFRVYLPVTPEAVPEKLPEPVVRCLIGSETILLVEDDEGLRDYAAEVLRKYGYLVYEAADGEEAFVISEAQGAKIDLVVCDVVMPNMGGEELVRKLRQAIHAPRVLFISGYTDDAIIVHSCSGVGISFLAKPFNPEQLGSKVREALQNESLSIGPGT